MTPEPPGNPDVPAAWQGLLVKLLSAGPGVVYVLGGADCGKSTLCDWLARRLSDHGRAAQIDSDPGQSRLGPPGTLALAAPPEAPPDAPALRFIGDVTPGGHLLDMLAGVTHLSALAGGYGARWIVCDSPGWVDTDAAGEYHAHVADALRPGVVAIDRDGELDGVLGRLRDLAASLHVLEPSQAVRPRSAAQRREFRRQRLADCFRGATRHELEIGQLGLRGRLPAPGLPGEPGTLLGLLDRRGLVVTLARLERYAPGGGPLTCLAPPHRREEVSAVVFGSMRLDGAAISP